MIQGLFYLTMGLYQREVFSIATIFCSILGPNFKHCCFKAIIILLSEEKGDSRSLLSHDRLYQTEVLYRNYFLFNIWSKLQALLF